VSAAVDAANAKQAAYWNGEAGRRWTEIQESQDRFLSAFTDMLLAAAAPKPGEAALDIGCGAGDTTLRVAAVTGRALGLDISEPMLARARERAAKAGSPAHFTLADATSHDLSAEAADLALSRFGVMFFAEPVRAFANLRRGLKPGGRLAFVCWRDPELNPWQMVPFEAARKHLPGAQLPSPDEPGPFAFRSADKVRGILEAAGFGDIRLDSRETALDIADAKGVEEAVAKSLSIGLTSRALADRPEAIRAAVIAELRLALAAHAQGASVPLTGRVWLVQARA
jgi:SAM-dependent methyltransferase